MRNAMLQGKEYFIFLNEIKQQIVTARSRAVKSINKELIGLYWNIGKTIVQRQEQFGWGESVVEQLARDIRKEFPNMGGYSSQNLWYMRQLYVAYKQDKILQQLVGEIPWGQNIIIFSRVKDRSEREYYLKATAQMGWSRNVLLNQVKADAYKHHKLDLKTHNFPQALPVHLAEQADESIKSIYNLDFLGITKPVLERELEKRLLEKLKDFLLELGYGFTFVGSQYKLILSNNEYFVDLLFYNRNLKALVALELKTGKFIPEYAGKMDFYLTLLDEQVKLKNENPSIGIILCAEKDNVIVEYALRNSGKPIGVAEYRLTSKLPRALKGKIPDEKILKKLLSKD